MTWVVDADGDLRYDAPDGTTQHILADSFDFGYRCSNEGEFGRLTEDDSIAAQEQLVQLVKDGLRFRQICRAVTQSGGLSVADAVMDSVLGILSAAEPHEKIAWRAP